MSWPSLCLAAFAVLFIGVAKAGFGGGLGMLVTPLCVLAFGPATAIGILLPLLCAGDAFSLWHYWRRWHAENLKFLLPGVVVGVIIGVQLVGQCSPRQLNLVIGLLAVLFAGFQFTKDRLFRAGPRVHPESPGRHAVRHRHGHHLHLRPRRGAGGGDVSAPQRLPKEIFVGTNVLLFAWVNWIKLPFFCVDRSMVNLPVFAPTP